VAPSRTERLSGSGPLPDQRNAFQLDRDRILYSTAFRRLAGVTQVVSPSEGEVFHNRLTHTLKVAQIARRLAEMFLARDLQHGTKIAQEWGGIEPEVVEAAALAHDLGHPPFGHIAEEELSHQVAEVACRAKPRSGKAKAAAPSEDDLKKAERYEGNAQSFRILTTLDVRRPGSKHGLDLTRATLNATLKYPWLWAAGEKKYGAYVSEKAAFEFARAGYAKTSRARSIEAQIMDWADDITYSVHDTEDFYRAGLIPLDRLAVNPKERSYFLDQALRRRQNSPKAFKPDADFLDIFNRFFESVKLREPYEGTRSQREALYEFTSATINVYVQETNLLPPPGANGEGLAIDPVYRTQVELLKELTWCYVINNPALAAHQHGQRLAIRTLFTIFDEAAEGRKWSLFPPLFREEGIELARQEDLSPARRARLVADTLAAMTDQQALRLYQRLSGLSQGSVLDPIVS
jgi:dGTPase